MLCPLWGPSPCGPLMRERGREGERAREMSERCLRWQHIFAHSMRIGSGAGQSHVSGKAVFRPALAPSLALLCGTSHRPGARSRPEWRASAKQPAPAPAGRTAGCYRALSILHCVREVLLKEGCVPEQHIGEVKKMRKMAKGCDSHKKRAGVSESCEFKITES